MREHIEDDVNVNEISIIIADDEIKTCEEIKEYLNKYNQIKILGIANNDDDEIKMIEELKPDVVVTDLMRKHKFTGLDIIAEYSKRADTPKFIVVSFCPDPAYCSIYKNIVDFVYKYPKIDGSELAYKIICAKRMIWKEQQDLLEQRRIKKQKRNSYLNKIKYLLFK